MNHGGIDWLESKPCQGAPRGAQERGICMCVFVFVHVRVQVCVCVACLSLCVNQCVGG